MKDGQRKYWLDDPKNVDRVVYGLYTLCALLVVPDVLHLYHKHVHFGFENFPGFHAWYGFASCVLLVLSAKLLRVGVKRDEDYYD